MERGVVAGGAGGPPAIVCWEGNDGYDGRLQRGQLAQESPHILQEWTGMSWRRRRGARIVSATTPMRTRTGATSAKRRGGEAASACCVSIPLQQHSSSLVTFTQTWEWEKRRSSGYCTRKMLLLCMPLQENLCRLTSPRYAMTIFCTS